MNVPNFLTGLRLVAVPVFVILFLSGRLGAALAVFIGAILDPLADKLLGLSALVLLCLSRRLPMWLLWLLIFREVCIFSAIAILNRTGRSYPMRPTRFGKYATAFLSATIIFALAQAARDVPAGPGLISLALVSALCIVVSWAQYLAIFIDLMRRAPQRA